jgi:hypothetical protein
MSIITFVFNYRIPFFDSGRILPIIELLFLILSLTAAMFSIGAHLATAAFMLLAIAGLQPMHKLLCTIL